MPFRDSIVEVSPPWLTERGGVAEAIQYAEGLVVDAIGQMMIEGVKAAMPGIGTTEALSLIGRDMQIDRGPLETDQHYVDRLRVAIDSHRVKGSAGELLKQLSAWFSPSVATPIRLVSNAAVWHEINLTTLVVTKTVVGTNWTWDALTATQWSRGWVVIDSSAGPWFPEGLWGSPGAWGDGGTWGSTATPGEVAAIRRIVDTWKPAHIQATNIIVSFSAGQFSRTNASPPNPSGNSDQPSWRLGYNAAFWVGNQ
jgi:hypothetical protein